MAAAILAAPLIGFFRPGAQTELEQSIYEQFDFWNLDFQASRLWSMFWCAYLPWRFMRRQAQEGLRFRKAWFRVLALVGIVFGLAFGWFLIRFLMLNIGFVRVFWLCAYCAFMAYLVVELLWKIRRQPETWRREVRIFFLEFFGLQKQEAEDSGGPVQRSENEPPSDEGPGPVGLSKNGKRKRRGFVLHSDVILARLNLTVNVSAPAKSLRGYLSVAGLGCLALFILATAIFWGVGAAVGVGLLLAVGFATYVVVIEPVGHAQRMRRQIGRALRRELSTDLASAFAAILTEIADDSHPAWVRGMYVDALHEIRFNGPLYEILDEFYQALREGPLKQRMASVVVRAMHEARKNAS